MEGPMGKEQLGFPFTSTSSREEAVGGRESLTAATGDPSASSSGSLREGGDRRHNAQFTSPAGRSGRDTPTDEAQV